MDNLIQLVSKLYQQMSSYIIYELEERGHNDLVLSHGTILMVLSHENSINVKELSSRINKSQQTMSTLLKKLENYDYVVVTKSETDKRNKLVSLTEKGKAFIPVMNQISKDLYATQYKHLSAEEIELVRHLIHKISKGFE